MAEVRVRALLKRPFRELPVAGDLPRLCNRMQVFVEQNEKNDENDAGPCITLTEASDDDEESIGGMKKEREGKMVYCTDSPKRENLRTLLSVLSSYLEPEVKRDVEAEFDEFFPPTAEISGLLQRFLEEKFGGNDSKVVRVIKACNQAIIAPIIIELKTQLGVENMTKDVAKSWTTKIFVEKDVILVCTYKREQHLQNNFQYEWELILTFDRKEIECTDIKVRVTDLMFHERLHTKETKKKEQVKAILGQLCIVEPQVLRESDTKTWEFYQNNDTMREGEKGEEKERQTNEDDQEEETDDTSQDDSSKEDRRLDISLENNPVWWLFLISSFTVLGGLLLLFK